MGLLTSFLEWKFCGIRSKEVMEVEHKTSSPFLMGITDRQNLFHNETNKSQICHQSVFIDPDSDRSICNFAAAVPFYDIWLR